MAKTKKRVAAAPTLSNRKKMASPLPGCQLLMWSRIMPWITGLSTTAKRALT